MSFKCVYTAIGYGTSYSFFASGLDTPIRSDAALVLAPKIAAMTNRRLTDARMVAKTSLQGDQSFAAASKVALYQSELQASPPHHAQLQHSPTLLLYQCVSALGS